MVKERKSIKYAQTLVQWVHTTQLYILLTWNVQQIMGPTATAIKIAVRCLPNITYIYAPLQLLTTQSPL